MTQISRAQALSEMDGKSADLTRQELDDISTEYNLDFWMLQFNRAFRSGRKNAMAEAFNAIAKIANTDPSHQRGRFATYNPTLDCKKVLSQWEVEGSPQIVEGKSSKAWFDNQEEVKW